MHLYKYIILLPRIRSRTLHPRIGAHQKSYARTKFTHRPSRAFTVQSMYSKSSAGPMLRCIDFQPLLFSSDSHFGETGGDLLRYVESPPRFLPFMAQQPVGRSFVVYMASASAPPRDEKTHTALRSIYYNSTVRPTQSIMHHEWRTTNHARRTNNSTRL